jgi:hypothetical protein
MNLSKVDTFQIVFFILIISSNGFSQKTYPNYIIEEINHSIFNGNVHYHDGYAQSYKRYIKPNGKIKSETIFYPGGSKMRNEYSIHGKLEKHEIFNNDSLHSWMAYEYDEDLRLVKERGAFNIDYFYTDSNNYFGISSDGDDNTFYRLIDTIKIFETTQIYRFEKIGRNNLWEIESFEFSYNRNGDLKRINLSLNDIQTGHILNKYDEKGRLIEHQYFHSYRDFTNERNWGKGFRNNFQEFTYNNLGLIETQSKSTYNPQKKVWESQQRGIKYEIKKESKFYHVKWSMNDEDYNELIIDKHGNWIEWNSFSTETTKRVKRVLEYY